MRKLKLQRNDFRKLIRAHYEKGNVSHAEDHLKEIRNLIEIIKIKLNKHSDPA